MSSEQVSGTQPPRVPLYNDPRVRSVVYQLGLAAIIARSVLRPVCVTGPPMFS